MDYNITALVDVGWNGDRADQTYKATRVYCAGAYTHAVPTMSWFYGVEGDEPTIPSINGIIEKPWAYRYYVANVTDDAPSRVGMYDSLEDVLDFLRTYLRATFITYHED